MLLADAFRRPTLVCGDQAVDFIRVGFIVPDGGPQPLFCEPVIGFAETV